jgi:hypothetical protein
MSVGSLPGLTPAPEFAVVGAAHVPFAAAPTMLFEATATDLTSLEIQSIALTAQLMIEPAQRGYDAETRERLAELFGPPASWAPATSGLPWARVAATVPAFRGETRFSLEVPCTYDLEVAATKYFYAVLDGEIPLTFHFNGNVFFRAPGGGQLQMAPIAWSTSAGFRMPVTAWQAMIADHYPGGSWIRVSESTMQALHDRRAARGLATFDQCVVELLEDKHG